MSEDPAPRVWGVGTSRTLRAHWTLCELGIDYEWRDILPRTESMHDPVFLERSRRGKVPILEHGQLVIGESGAIVLYLVDRYRDRTALAPPPATPERARFNDRFLFTLTELDSPLYIIRRHAGLPDVYGESPVAVRSAREYFERQAQVAASWLEPEGHALGGEFSAADLMLASCTAWAQIVAIALPDPLADHLARMRERPGFVKAFANNFPPEALAALTPGRVD
ncbi:MAG: glutathione S-transferase family protein [bacterium]|nr:glutathione S-transferase family protein [bacterium]